MHRRSIYFGLSILIAATFGSFARADEEAPTVTDASSKWITSIAPLGSNRFVAGTADGLLLREASVFSFKGSNPAELEILYTHPAAVWCVDTTPDGRVASVDYKGNLAIYDAVTGGAITHEKAFERWCQAMIIAPGGRRIVAGNEAGKVMVWDMIAGKVVKSVEVDKYAVTGLSLSPDETTLAATDGGGHVHLMKWPTLEAVGEIEVSDDTAWCLAFVEGGKKLLVGSADRHLYLCDAADGAKAKSIAKGSDWITQIAVSPTGQVAAAEVGGKLHFPSTGGTDSMEAESGVWSLCWNDKSQLFAGTRKDGIVMASRSWAWTEPTPEAEVEEEQVEEATEESATEESTEAETASAEEKPAESSEQKADDSDKEESDNEEKDDAASEESKEDAAEKTDADEKTEAAKEEGSKDA